MAKEDSLTRRRIYGFYRDVEIDITYERKYVAKLDFDDKSKGAMGLLKEFY